MLTITAQKSNQGIQLTNSVLQRRSGQTPLVLCAQSESGFRCIGTSFFDVVSFIEDHAKYRTYQED